MKQLSISREEIEDTLNKSGIEFEQYKPDEYGYSRTIKFTLFSIDYYIVWWSNVSYLSVGNLHCNSKSFHHVEIDTCYPSYKKGLAFTTFNSNGFNETTYVAIKLLDWQMEQLNIDIVKC